MQTLDETTAARVIMTSPFVDVVTYRVLDACRILIAHDRRHVEQAHRVTLSPGFDRCDMKMYRATGRERT